VSEKTTYRITEKARLIGTVTFEPPPYTIDAVYYEIRDGLALFYDNGLRLALSTDRIERIEQVAGGPEAAQ
jgi:hypothetical protein